MIECHKRRETRVRDATKNAARRRLAFPGFRTWRCSRKDNPWIRYEGWTVTIFA